MSNKNSKGLVAQGAYIEVTHTHTTDVEFVAATKKIIRSEGSFIDDGYLVGQTVETDAAGDNAGPFTIATVAALELTLVEAPTDAAEAETVITAFQKVGEVVNFDTPRSEPSEIEMSHLESTYNEFRNGLRDGGSISGEMNFVASDPGQKILVAMSGEVVARTMRITLPPYNKAGMTLDGYQWTFPGLGRGVASNVAVNSRVTRSFTIRVSGEPTEQVIVAGA